MSTAVTAFPQVPRPFIRHGLKEVDNMRTGTLVPTITMKQRSDPLCHRVRRIMVHIFPVIRYHSRSLNTMSAQDTTNHTIIKAMNGESHSNFIKQYRTPRTRGPKSMATPMLNAF